MVYGGLREQRYIRPYLKVLNELGLSEYSDIARERLEQCRELCLSRLVIVLGTKCSLRCKECNNLMPYFKPQSDLPLKKVLGSLQSVLAQTHSLLRCELIGGEPFLSANLGPVLDFVLRQPQIEQVEITTNATVLPKSELLPTLRNPKVLVRISDYGDLVDKRQLQDFLRQNSVRQETLQLGLWSSSGGVNKRSRSTDELRRQYSKCSSGYYCKTLYDGKLFACARAASLWALGYMKEPEYIEVDSADAEEIRRFLLKDYSWACDYCDQFTLGQKKVKPAEQLPKPGNEQRKSADPWQRFLFPWDLVRPGSHIILRGGGEVGQAFARQLLATRYAFLEAICDQKVKYITGLSVPFIQVQDLPSFSYDVVVIAIEKTNVATEMREELLAMGVPATKIIYANPAR